MCVQGGKGERNPWGIMSAGETVANPLKMVSVASWAVIVLAFDILLVLILSASGAAKPIEIGPRWNQPETVGHFPPRPPQLPFSLGPTEAHKP